MNGNAAQSHGVEPGTVWISRDPRDQGLRVTVLEVESGFVRYKRFNRRRTSVKSFLNLYRPTVTP